MSRDRLPRVIIRDMESMSLERSVITDAALLESLRSEWEDLLHRSATDEPMLSPPWLLAWWRVFGAKGGRSLAVVACREGGKLVGLAPLVKRQHRVPPGIGFRRLELLGTGEDEAEEICSEYLGILAERGSEARVADAVAAAIVEGMLGRWDEIVMPAMNGDAVNPGLFGAELSRLGIEVDISSTGSAPYIALPKTFAAYLAGLPSSGRYLVTRSLRDFEAWAGGDGALSVASSPADLDEGKRILFALHAARWGGGGAFASPRFRAFHEAVMPELFARGALELAWISAHGAPVAIAYGIVWRDKVYFYQSGRTIDVPKGVRPGIALHALLVKRAIEIGRREYDFLDGASRYKRALATGSRPIVRLRAVRDPEGIRERTRVLCERGIADVRMIRRAIRGDEDRPLPVASRVASRPVAVLLGDMSMLRCFADQDIRAVILSHDADAPAFFSRLAWQRRLIANTRAAPEAVLADLLSMGRLLGDRSVLFYGDDATLLLTSRNRAALGAHYRFLMPPPDVVEALVDKLQFASLARDLGLPAPRTITSAEAGTAAEIARAVRLPCILKPSCHLGFRTSKVVLDLGVGPVKALSADTEDDLGRMLERIRAFSPDFVVQEYIPGGEENVRSFHAYVDARGRTLGSFAGRKIRTYPRRAGTSTYLEIVGDPALVRAGAEVVEKLGIAGVVKLDFKRDPRTGKLHLLEVNPRFSLWNHLGAAAGVNLPVLAYRDLVGDEEGPPPHARTGMRWLSFADDARTFARSFRPAGELSFASWLWSLRGPKVYDIFAWDDPSPFFANAIRAIRSGKGRVSRR